MKSALSLLGMASMIAATSSMALKKYVFTYFFFLPDP